MLKRKGRGGVKGVLSNVKKNCRIRKQVHPLWKDPATKSDEFLEKVQTAFDPPLIFGKLCCILLFIHRGAFFA